jgi:hypothetical protein
MESKNFPPSPPPSNSSPVMPPPVTAEDAAEGTVWQLRADREPPDELAGRRYRIRSGVIECLQYDTVDDWRESDIFRDPAAIRATGCYDEIPPVAPSPSPATTGGESAEALRFARELFAMDATKWAERIASRDATLSAAHAEKVRELANENETLTVAHVKACTTIAALTKERDEERALTGVLRERLERALQSDAKCLCGGVSTRWLALDGKPAIHIRHEISETMLVEEYKVVPDSLLAALASSGAKGGSQS